MPLTPQFMGAVGTAMKDLLLAHICSAVAGVDIDIFGVHLQPFAFLQQWATDLQDQASQAINDAATAQTSADTAHTAATTAQATADSKPGITQIPISSTLWGSINNDEDSTFPRSQLTFGAASSTASASGDSHSHSLNSIPQYQPSGNGGDTLEIAYIRCTRDRTYTTAGFITGGSATFAGITGAYIGVFKVNTSTGALTLLNTTSAAIDVSTSITTQNTEQRFALGMTITAHQNDVYAVGVLQVTSIFQTCASVLKTTLTDIAPPVTQYPRKNYCYAGSYTSIPSTIAESSLNYGSSTKLPFYVLR